MNYKEQLFGYFMDVEEDLAAEIIRDSVIDESLVDVAIPSDYDEWSVCSFRISVRSNFYKGIDGEFKTQKDLIEKALASFVEKDNKSANRISWHPLPRIYREIEKNNQHEIFRQYLEQGDLDRFFKLCKSIFASLSYNIKITEAYFHSNIHVLVKALGFKIISEDETNLGRIDATIELADRIYIIEFKLTEASAAIDQIRRKKYFEKYDSGGKKIVLVGVACDTHEKNLKEWVIEEHKTTN